MPDNLAQIRLAVAARVRSLRRSRHWTQAELGARLGLSQSRLSEIERGEGSFSAEQLLLLGRLFNVPPSEFGPARPADEQARLQNALARLGAHHLAVREDVAPDDALDVSRVIRDALISGLPRFVTALAPILVSQVDRLSIPRLRAVSAEAGIERRLFWLIENCLQALRRELETTLSQVWAARYRRAAVVLEAALEAELARGAESAPPDVLDPDIRSRESRLQTEDSASAASRRWGIVTALGPEDFTAALGDARVCH